MADTWIDLWSGIWDNVWGVLYVPVDAEDSEYFNTQIEIYADTNTNVMLDIINARVEPTCLTELRAHGAGSFKVSKNDSKILENPSLLDYRKYVKVRLNGTVVGGFIIQTKKTVIVGEGEEADESWEISGEGQRSASRDAAVYPALGLKATSADTRYFNFATEQGSWYKPSEWANATTNWTIRNKGNPWGTAPAEWPDAPLAYWIWDRWPAPMPQGYVYFRKEFTVATAASHSLFIAVDDRAEIYVDGELLLTTAEKGWQTTNRIDMELEAGPHVIGVKAYNIASGAASMVASFFKFGDPLVPSSAQLLFVSNNTWKVRGYPAVEPGWTIGDILLTLLNEAKARGVRFANNWTPTFTALNDSAGQPWGEPIQFSLSVGATYEDAISALEEMGCDIFVDPDTLAVSAWKKRGSDKSLGPGPVYNPDAIIFSPGHNLRSAEETGQAEIANTLMLHSKEGWKESAYTDTTSITRYGRVETQLSTDLSAAGAAPIVQELFRTKALPEKSATFDIVSVDDMIPFLNFNVGDIVSAPGEVPGLMESRRIMSISFSEDSGTGRPEFSLEFDTIFKDRQTELEKWVSRISNSSAIGGGFTNSSSLPPTSQVGQPGTPVGNVPDAPTGLVVSSLGKFSADGTSSSDFGLTWNPVVTGSGFGTITITQYEVWGRLATETEFSLLGIVFDSFAYLTGFRTGDSWVFKVRAVSSSGGPGDFSEEVALTAANPAIVLGKPTAPSLSSSMGTVTIRWDGLIAGTPAPGYVRYVRVERTRQGSTGTWEEKRRNVFANPYAKSSLSRFSSSGGTDVSLSLRTDMTAPTTTAVRSTRNSTASSVRLVDFIAGTEMLASTSYRTRVRVRSSHELTGVIVAYRPAVGTSGVSVVADTVDIPVGVSYVDVIGLTHVNAPTATAGVSFIHSGGTIGATLDVTDISIEKMPSDGTMVAGDLTSSDPTKRYRWLGTADNSVSVYEELDAWVAVGTLVRGSTVDASVLTGKSYDYRLVAIDTYGGESLASDKSTIIVKGVQSGDITGGLASQNLVANGSFEDDLANWVVKSIYPNGGSSAVVVTGGIAGFKYLRLTRGVEIPGAETELIVAQDSASLVPISSVGASGYFVSAKVASSTAEAEGFSMRVYWYTGDKVTPASTAVSTVVDEQNVSTTAQYFVGQVFPPDDARFMQVAVVSARQDSILFVDDVVAREVISEGMIGQGAVTAPHLSAGSVTANALQAGSVTADALAAGSVVADKIGAGEIQTNHLSSDVGASLDISSNASVNILINRTDTLEGDLESTQGAITDLQTYYSFTSEGAVIGKTDSAFKLFLKNDRIEILENNVVVSYWDSGQMVVKRFVGEEVVLANHKIEKYTTGTIVKKL